METTRPAINLKMILRLLHFLDFDVSIGVCKDAKYQVAIYVGHHTFKENSFHDPSEMEDWMFSVCVELIHESVKFFIDAWKQNEGNK